MAAPTTKIKKDPLVLLRDYTMMGKKVTLSEEKIT
jgi:hypothetical protein